MATKAGMLGAINAALDRLEKLNSVPYDGILGRPPNWLPAPLLHEFHAARDNLLSDHSANEVRRWMRACRGLAVYPSEHAREVEALVYIEQIVGLGETNGIDAYLGRGRFKVLRAYAERPPSATEIIEGHELEKGLRQRQKAGDTTAAKKRAKNADRDQKIRDAADRLLKQGKARRVIASALARSGKWLNDKGAALTSKQIGRILKGRPDQAA